MKFFKSLIQHNFLLTDLLTFLLMPSDKHNSRMARAKDLISSLINIISSWDVPFHQLQQLQCLHHGDTFESLCAPIFSSQPYIGENLWLAHNGFSVRHKYHWNTSNSYNVMKSVRNCWNRGVMAFTHRDMGCTLHK